jgi:UbiD family decarboxylase
MATSTPAAPPQASTAFAPPAPSNATAPPPSAAAAAPVAPAAPAATPANPAQAPTPPTTPTGPPPGATAGGPPPWVTAAATGPNEDVAREPLQGPYDSIRDYLEALEATGNLIRIPEMDQDQYETTAFCYRLMERIGYWKAPAFLVERVKIDGQWVEGPLLGNAYGPWAAEALCMGVPPSEITGDHEQMYRRAMSEVDKRLGFGIPKIPPVEVDRATAPVKEVVLTGDQIDLTSFAFIQTNPADAGRYMTTGSVIMSDPELGKNVGTYRCQIKGPRQIGVNPEPGQDGWRMLMAAKKRGDKVMKCSIVMGADPLLFTASSTKLGGPGQDELAQAGGLKGSPVAIVKSEHSDIDVPAYAEMVIEGEIPLDDMLPEAPFAELYGYLGQKKDANFYMNVTAVTHRVKPIIVNAYTGVARAYCTAPVEAAQRARFRLTVPGLLNVHILLQALGVFIVQIDKTKPGQGISAGIAASASSSLAKVTIVVDKDVNIYSMEAVMAAFGSRWQPHPGTVLIPQVEGVPLDPSAPNRGLTSKIIIDATRQFPEEGGPAFNAPVSRELMEELAPNAFANIDAQWDALIARIAQ